MILAKPLPKDIKSFILEWAEKYKNKFGIISDIYCFHSGIIEIEEEIDGILMKSNKYIPGFQFWFSHQISDE